MSRAVPRLPAPASASFFYGVGVPLLEGYGLTETAPVLVVSIRANAQIRDCRPAVPNVELRIADDGEILAPRTERDGGLLQPARETADGAESDGWFHTGDVGRSMSGLSADHRCKKELLVTSGGKKIAPAADRVRSCGRHALVAEAVVVGEARISVRAHRAGFPEAFAAGLQASFRPGVGARAEELVARRRCPGALHEVVETAQPRTREIRALKMALPAGRILDRDSGELTPTLKLRRRVVLEGVIGK